jgi:hypothetical protein
LLSFAAVFTILLCTGPAIAATTELHIVKYANDRTTVLAEKTLTYQEMKDTLPVQGDGSTHYYHQGPVFVDDPDNDVEQQLRWNPDEDTNVMEKDMGAVMGTSVKDLCDLVGGMTAGDTLAIVASDGLTREFAYRNVYTPPARQGPMVITWYCSDSTISTCSGPYPDSGYADGMRLVFLADTAVNPWGAPVFGNFDWYESADEEYWYYYHGDAGERYPTTTGLAIKYVSEIRIYSSRPPASFSNRHSSGGASGIPLAGEAPPEDTTLYGYTGKSMSTAKSGVLNGSVRLFSAWPAEPLIANNRIREFNISVDLPPGSNLTLARLYFSISRSHNLQTKKGTVPWFLATFDSYHLAEDMLYIDTDGDGNRQLAATYAYDVLSLIRRNGTFPVSVRNLDPEQSLFTIDGVFLVIGYENETDPVTSYWISEGCDVISTIPKKGLFPDECQTDYPFSGKINMTTVRNAQLSLVSTGLDLDIRTEHTVKFNNQAWQNIFDSNSTPGLVHFPVTNYLNETGNAATVESSIRSLDADYLINRLAILIVQDKDAGPPAVVEDTSTPANEHTDPSFDLSEPLPRMNESSRCEIELDTDPEGALIFVDGRYLGKTTPYTLDVEKGESHTIRFELDGYSPSDVEVMATNSTCIHTSLWAPVYSTKGRLPEDLLDPDGIRYGGLYIHSRPHNAAISLNGIETGKITPAVFMGLEPGSYTITLGKVQDIIATENNLFDFPEQMVWVWPEELTPADINGIGHHVLSDIIIDSHTYRGLPFTVNGYIGNKTVPSRVSTPLFDSFITILENGSFVSYPIPVPFVPVPYGSDDDRYLLFDACEHQNLDIAVNTSPPGAGVFIDGFRTGYTTPYTFGNISEGPHRITVTKNGYLPQQVLIDLPRRAVPISTTAVDLILEEYPSGFLYVSSVPEGGKIWIDSVFTGEITPALFKSLPTGAHLVEVRGENSTKTFYDVTVNSLDMTVLTADISPDME